MDDIRTIRQKEFADVFLTERRNGILYLCPRFGKCRTTIHIFNATNEPKVLIAYPNITIKDSWIGEMQEMNYNNPNIIFCTHRSLEKYNGDDFDLIVIDEIHELSDNQIDVLRKIRSTGVRLLGLTGTMSKWTQKSLKAMLGMDILAKYSISQAIQEGIIPDYQITVKTVPFDTKEKIKFGKSIKTEKKHFDAYSFIIDKLEKEKKDTKFLRLARMRLVQNSIAKRKETIKLIEQFKDERILVFSGLTIIADSFGIPSYHSKKTDSKIFDDFKEGLIDKIAVVDIGGTGTTYKPLSKVVVNYFDSNPENLAQKVFRCMSMEYNNPNKKADVWIISSDEQVELDWLKKGLEFFDENKIVYI